MKLAPSVALLAAFLSVAAPSRASDLQCSDLPTLLDSFERSHYAVKKTTDAVKEHSADQFVRILDPSRTMLLDSDAAHLKSDLITIFDTMKSGDCAVLTDSLKLVIQRSEEDERIVKDLLNDRYKLDETVQLVLDPQKRGYPKTNEERTALVRKMAHFQISSYMTTGLDLAAAKKQLIHRYALATKRLKERLTSGKLPGIYAEAFASALDPHSSFMSADQLADFQIQMRLSLEGIGAALSSQDGLTVIESLVPGGQAERDGRLRPKDRVLAVAQDGEKPVPTMDLELTDVVKMIRGKKGTKVTLSVLREGKETKSFDVTIVRDKIDVKEQAAKLTYETRKVGDRNLKIGILDLPSFYGGGGEQGGRSSYADVKKLIEEARDNKVDGVVIDLSRNGGGLLEEAVKIAGLFMRRGGVVATKDASGKVDVLWDDDDDVAYSGPVVVLTSPASASASEILAGALKDYHRALIAGGERTFGKGTVQVLSPLPRELGAMKVTTGMFFLPGGASTQQKGVAADVRVPSVFDGYDLGEKMLDYSLPPQSTQPFVSPAANSKDPAHHWKPIDETLVPRLAERSKDRVSKDPDFAEVKKQLEEIQKSKGVVRLADLRKRKADQDKDKDKDKLGESQEKGKPNAAKGKDKGKDKGKGLDMPRTPNMSAGDASASIEDKSDRDPNGPNGDAKAKAKETQAAFVKEGVNIMVDMITLGVIARTNPPL